MRVPQYYYTMLPTFLFIMVLIMIFVLLKYKGIDNVDFFKQRILKNKVKGLNKNLRNIFHSFKNTLFTLNIMSKQLQLEKNTDDQLVIIKEMEQITQKSIESITKMLDSLEIVQVHLDKVKIIDVIDSAIERIDISSRKISVIKEYKYPDAEVNVDVYHIGEAIHNILQNSVEAIESANRENGSIMIEVIIEYEWVVIRIRDNGIGIKKENINNIFKSFHTTKSRLNNWGVGLSYAYNVVKKHLGYITVDSKFGEFTTVQILLPKFEG